MSRNGVAVLDIVMITSLPSWEQVAGDPAAGQYPRLVHGDVEDRHDVALAQCARERGSEVLAADLPRFEVALEEIVVALDDAVRHLLAEVGRLVGEIVGDGVTEDVYDVRGVGADARILEKNGIILLPTEEGLPQSEPQSLYLSCIARYNGR